jgi:hypothetical protein
MEILIEKSYRWRCEVCDYASLSKEDSEEMAVEGYKWHERTSMRHALKEEATRKEKP